jgi:hypothetical protein
MNEQNVTIFAYVNRFLLKLDVYMHISAFCRLFYNAIKASILNGGNGTLGNNRNHYTNLFYDQCIFISLIVQTNKQ